jgi:N-acyl-D-aspartate/D-glutamate deacylase
LPRISTQTRRRRIAVFDILIADGLIVDGTGAKAVRADVGVSAGRISAVGDLGAASAAKVIDASGLVVCPGFIDVHTHDDLHILEDPAGKEKLRQGVTTELVGNCGLSVAPVCDEWVDAWARYLSPVTGTLECTWTWRSFAEYVDMVRARRPSLNVGMLVGHGPVRASVAGFARGTLSQEEISQAALLVRECMNAGALGFTTGLIYSPACYASDSEMVELCRAVAEAGGCCAFHIRNESDMLVESVQESLDIARASGTRVTISHHKASGRRNWGKTVDTLKLIDKAVDEGVEAFSDQYPYIVGSTTATALFPKWCLEGGIDTLTERLADTAIRERISREIVEGLPGWDCVVRENGWENIILSWVNGDENMPLTGKTLAEIGDLLGVDPAIALMQVVREERGQAAVLLVQQCEEDLRAVMKHRRTMIGSDSLYGGKMPHPRRYGTFPRLLGRYVREKKALSLEEAVYKMTGMPALAFGLRDIGVIRKGYWADIVAFDADVIRDTATYKNPAVQPKGVELVIVSGVVSLIDRQCTGKQAGRILSLG